MTSRKEALRLARQYRSCPPPDIVGDPRHRRLVMEHLKLCPYCFPEVNELTARWTEMIAKIEGRGFQPPSCMGDGSPVPGDLRPVHRDLASWRDGFYYSPPLVLVLHSPRAISDDLTVAQTYPDPMLAGEGDLILTDDQTGAGELFVETWHRYTLKAAHLGPARGRVSTAILTAIEAMIHDSRHLPEWAPLTLPMTAEDPRIYFRKIEVEVGFTVASQSAAVLIAEMEAGGLPGLYPSPEALVDELTGRVPGIHWTRPRSDPLALIASAQFPDAYYARAAAADAQEWIWANMAMLREGGLESFQPVRVQVFTRHQAPEGLDLGGKIHDIPENFGEVSIHCFLEMENGDLKPSDHLDWDAGNRYFFASFSIASPGNTRIRIALVCRR